MTRELRKEAKKFISETGYGTGTNFTTGQVATLMARFATDVINKNAVLRSVSGSAITADRLSKLDEDIIKILEE